MKDNKFSLLKKMLLGVRQNIPMAKHTTFCIGGPAEYFFIAKNKADVGKAAAAAKKLKLPLFIFGGGSNLLVSDKGIKGLVVRMKSQEKRFKVQPGNKIEAYSGVNLGNLVAFSVKRGLQGLEWAGGLPGTFGGAVRGNAGAFGGEMKDVVAQVQALNNFKLRAFTNKQSRFSYRNSVFKEKNWTIVSSTVKFHNGNKKELEAIANSHINYRKERHPLEYPSAGSVFKNVAVENIPEQFKHLFLDKIKQDPFPIVPAAWFIIGAGLTGKKIGQTQVSKKHSNYIVNLGAARASDVLKLMNFIKKKVKAKYHILLEPEVQYVD